jgi:hypothetical protein
MQTSTPIPCPSEAPQPSFISSCEHSKSVGVFEQPHFGEPMKATVKCEHKDWRVKRSRYVPMHTSPSPFTLSAAMQTP